MVMLNLTEEQMRLIEAYEAAGGNFEALFNEELVKFMNEFVDDWVIRGIP